MTVVPFKRPESRETKPPLETRRSFAQFAVAMAMTGLVFFLMPKLWPSVPQLLLAVIHLLLAVVYVQQGPRIAALLWVALTLAVLVLTGAPSPITYLLSRGASAFDAMLIR